MRNEISKTIGYDLNRFAWGRDLKHDIRALALDGDIEDLVDSMAVVLDNGLNIGHCDLTSRYIVRAVPDSEIVHGVLPIIMGTPGSPMGQHAWVITDKTVIDPTLMVELPFGVAEALGYDGFKKLAKDSASILSEYDTYSNEIRVRNRNKTEEMLRATSTDTRTGEVGEEKGHQKSLKIVPFPKAVNM